MRRLTFAVAALVASVLVSTGTQAVEPSGIQTQMCAAGPLYKDYGNTQWLVYSCDDSRTLVFVSAPGSAAAPYYFKLAADRTLTGQGSGYKPAQDAAYTDIKGLSERDINDLIEQTKKLKK